MTKQKNYLVDFTGLPEKGVKIYEFTNQVGVGNYIDRFNLIDGTSLDVTLEDLHGDNFCIYYSSNSHKIAEDYIIIQAKRTLKERLLTKLKNFSANLSSYPESTLKEIERILD